MTGCFIPTHAYERAVKLNDMTVPHIRQLGSHPCYTGRLNESLPQIL
jgi:hypothetical protein